MGAVTVTGPERKNPYGGLTVPEASLFFVEDEKSTHVVRAYQLNNNSNIL